MVPDAGKKNCILQFTAAAAAATAAFPIVLYGEKCFKGQCVSQDERGRSNPVLPLSITQDLSWRLGQDGSRHLG